MLYIYYGNNQDEVRKRALARVALMTQGAREPVRITGDEYQEGVLTELAGGASLFGGTEVILLDTPSEREDFHTAVFENLELLKQSSHTFVLIEHSLTAGEKKDGMKYGEECVEIKEEKEKLNIFALSDALSERNKKELWLILIELVREGVPYEEIIGILFWQLKVLRLAERTESAEDAGQKPFVYGKAKRALIKFKKGELEELSTALLTLYHDGHLGKRDLGLALEKWVLTL